MTDEVKEILDYLGNDKNYNCDCNDGSYYLELPYREAHELKDCITKLQRESNILKEALLFIWKDYKQDTIDIDKLEKALKEIKGNK